MNYELRILRTFFPLLVLSSFFFSCKRTEVTEKTIHNITQGQAEYVYDLNNIIIRQDGVDKSTVKSLNEFASIAYTDLFEATLSQQNLNNLNLAYASFGDKKLVEELIIKNFLNNSNAIIPTTAEMNADVNTFTINTYKKFYNRVPNEFEKWKLKDFIEKNQAIVTPEIIYFSFMTSDEYRYY